MPIFLSGHCVLQVAVNASQRYYYAYSVEYLNHLDLWHYYSSVSLTKQKLMAEIRAIRWTDRLIQSDASNLAINDVWLLPQYSWNDGMRNIIDLMASILRQLPFWVWDFVRLLAAREFILLIARNYCVDLYSWLFVSLREFRKCLHKFLVRETIECVHAFTVIAHTTMADLLTLDPLSSCDTDSSFWVCNNSTMGHVCNNQALFTDEFVPLIFEVGSATGISAPNLMGTVTL